MTNETGSGAIPSPNELTDVLTRVRQIDPTAEAAAVRGYMREMAEADAQLATVDLGDAPLVVSFTARWPDGSAR